MTENMDVEKMRAERIVSVWFGMLFFDVRKDLDCDKRIYGNTMSLPDQRTLQS